MKFVKDAELDQQLRIVVAVCAIVYISLRVFLPGQSMDRYMPVIIYICLFLLVSVVLRQGLHAGGHYPAATGFRMTTPTPALVRMVVGGGRHCRCMR